MKEAIYIDQERVEKLWEKCQHAVSAMQLAVDQLAKTDCEFSADEIWKLAGANAQQVTAAVMDKKLKIETPKIFGIKLSRAKLLEMVEIDNLSEIVEALYALNAPNIPGTEGLWPVRKYIEVKNRRAYVADAARKAIVAECTLYAVTKEQSDKAESVKLAADALNNMLETGAVWMSMFNAPRITGLVVVGYLDAWRYEPDKNVLRQIVEG